MWMAYWGPQGLPWKENWIPSINKDFITREYKKNDGACLGKMCLKGY